MSAKPQTHIAKQWSSTLRQHMRSGGLGSAGTCSMQAPTCVPCVSGQGVNGVHASWQHQLHRECVSVSTNKGHKEFLHLTVTDPNSKRGGGALLFCGGVVDSIAWDPEEGGRGRPPWVEVGL